MRAELKAIISGLSKENRLAAGRGNVRDSEDLALTEDIINLVYQKVPTYFSDIQPGFSLVRRSTKVDYFSYLLELDIISPNGECNYGVFVKISRRDWSHCSLKKEINNPEARKAGKEEYLNLVNLSKCAVGSLIMVGWIKPLDYYEEFNAIVTAKVFGIDLFKVCQKARKGTKEEELCLIAIKSCGEWLSEFHKKTKLKDDDGMLTNVPNVKNEIAFYQENLEKYYSGKWFLNLLKGQINKLLVNFGDAELNIAASIEGLEIRNAVISREGIFFLDPGGISRSFVYQDLAHFIVSLIILKWGTVGFVLSVNNYKGFINIFLQGYRLIGDQIDDDILLKYIIKELLHSWLEAFVSISTKPWSWLGREMMSLGYVSPFYYRTINLFLKTN